MTTSLSTTHNSFANEGTLSKSPMVAKMPLLYMASETIRSGLCVEQLGQS